MDWNQVLAMLQQVLPPAYIHKGLEILGALALLSQLGPRLLKWGLPAATNAADAVAKVLLNSPARGAILWAWKQFRADEVIDAVVDALEQIATTFKNRLEADIAAAQPPAPPPPADAPKNS